MLDYQKKDHETIELGKEGKDSLYLRKGYFVEKVIIDSSHEYYQKLLNFLDDKAFVIFLKRDIEFRFLKDIFISESKEIL